MTQFLHTAKTMMEAWVRPIRVAKTGVLVVILGAIPTGAIAQTLPPPPPDFSGGRSAPLPTVAPSAPLPTVPIQPRSGQPQTLPNERVFTAPRVNPGVVNPVRSSLGGGFRVVVDDPNALQQVRFVQPDAFIQNIDGRQVIQAGLFSNEINARQQVSLLANQGINSRVTTQSGQVIGNGNANGNTNRNYFVVIPGQSNDMETYYSRIIQLGIAQSAIQMRDRPIGPHLSVGPFASRREAERVSNDLRDRANLDARVFYDR